MSKQDAKNPMLKEGTWDRCGTPVSIKLSKHDIAYYTCFAPSGHTPGEYCGARRFYGKAATERMKRELERQKETAEFDARKKAAESETSWLGN